VRVARSTRYWANRPGGTSARAASGSVWGADQADHVSSGSPTLPVRTRTETDVPSGRSARHVRAPNRLTSLASRTSEVRLPCATRPGSSRSTAPGSPAPMRTSPPGPSRRARIWPWSSGRSGRPRAPGRGPRRAAPRARCRPGGGPPARPGRRPGPWPGRPRAGPRRVRCGRPHSPPRPPSGRPRCPPASIRAWPRAPPWRPASPRAPAWPARRSLWRSRPHFPRSSRGRSAPGLRSGRGPATGRTGSPGRRRRRRRSRHKGLPSGATSSVRISGWGASWRTAALPSGPTR
jgi:hypothetical protein